MAKIKITTMLHFLLVTADHDAARSKQSQLYQLLHGAIYYTRHGKPMEKWSLDRLRLSVTTAETQGPHGNFLSMTS